VPVFSNNGRYNNNMGAKVSSVNRYLRDPDVREKTVTRSVATSSAIEGIRAPFGQRAYTSQTKGADFKQKKS
jgi:hypothetical protein